MKKCNLVVAAVSVLLGLLIIYLSRNLAGWDDNGVPGENYWPSIIAYLFVGLGIVQFLEVWLSPHKNSDKTVDLGSAVVRKAYLAALVSVVYGGLLTAAGFVIATVAFVPTMTVLMGERRLWAAALLAVGVVGVIYIFFALVFNTTLPTSVFFE
jgi:putative tricarboxylic transport membrane protein